MLITLLIFCTVSVGIARMENLKQVRRVGFKTILCFEVRDDDRFVIGLVIAAVVHPGAGLNIDPAVARCGQRFALRERGARSRQAVFWVGCTGRSSVRSRAVICCRYYSFRCCSDGVVDHVRAQPVLQRGIEQFGDVLMRIVEMIMQLAPLGAFGAIAFTVVVRHCGSLQQLGLLILCFIAAVLFVVVLGMACHWAGVVSGRSSNTCAKNC